MQREAREDMAEAMTGPHAEEGRGFVVSKQTSSLLAGGILNLECEQLLELRNCRHTYMNICYCFPRREGP